MTLPLVQLSNLTQVKMNKKDIKKAQEKKDGSEKGKVFLPPYLYPDPPIMMVFRGKWLENGQGNDPIGDTPIFHWTMIMGERV